LSGVVDVVLGVLIWRELPMSGLTIIGVLVGISIIFRGVSWLMVGFALKRLPATAAGLSFDLQTRRLPKAPERDAR
jgi:hypothetical protein